MNFTAMLLLGLTLVIADKIKIFVPIYNSPRAFLPQIVHIPYIRIIVVEHTYHHSPPMAVSL